MTERLSGTTRSLNICPRSNFSIPTTRELTLRDLVTHRSGLERGDLLWYASPYDRNEVLRRVRFLKPSWSLRSRFGYQNIMFLAAADLAPR